MTPPLRVAVSAVLQAGVIRARLAPAEEGAAAAAGRAAPRRRTWTWTSGTGTGRSCARKTSSQKPHSQCILSKVASSRDAYQCLYRPAVCAGRRRCAVQGCPGCGRQPQR
ncbi:hypothetical protein C8R47DRAFT_1088761, partial [Mycena vitilis]